MFETATRVLKNRNASKDAYSRFSFDKGARPLTIMGNRSVYLYEMDSLVPIWFMAPLSRNFIFVSDDSPLK